MEFNNRFSILSSLENDEPLLPQSYPRPEEEQDLSDHEIRYDWLRDLANRKRFEAKPVSSSLDLCNMCCKIFSACDLSLGSNQSHPHHPSHESLVKAAQQNCYICSLLLENSKALLEQSRWPAIIGSRKQRWLSYRVELQLDGDFSISFLLDNPKSSEILQLTVFAYCE